MGSLDGRVIAIAGATGGLGPVVARRLAEAGATIAAADRDQARLDALGAELATPADGPETRHVDGPETGLEVPKSAHHRAPPADGPETGRRGPFPAHRQGGEALEGRWDGRAVDLLDEEATREWCAALLDRFGRVDGLLHLVGGWRGGQPLHEAPLADWDLLHDLLVRTVQHTTRAFHDALLASGRGRFVLVSAKQAQAPSDSNAAYAAAKAAAEAWTLALADGFKGDGATANIVVVEAILTPQMREENPGKEFPTFTPAEHIAEAIAFLCSDAAAKMNGQRLALTMR